MRTRLLASLLTLGLTLGACSEPVAKHPPWQKIAGRDIEPAPIYRARVPAHWERIDPSDRQTLTDTTLSIVEYRIGEVIVAVHNFPYDTLDQRVPPIAQVSRWQRQLTDSDPSSQRVEPYSHGGFSGIAFSGEGTLKGATGTMVKGWAMQLAVSHFRTLQHCAFPRRRQQRGDYTIKATGPTEAIIASTAELECFARSFELIEEVPSR